MFIIVEGADGAGKTTLIKKLLEQFPGAKYLHFGVPDDPKTQVDMYLQALQCSSSQHSIVIIDRCWYSDMVYAPIMRGTLGISIEQSNTLDRAVMTYGGGMVIYCTAPVDVLWERCEQRGEHYIRNIETLQSISEIYPAVMRESLLPVIVYNTAE